MRVIYDWFGCGFGPIRGLFTPLIRAGGDVRVFNPPGLSSALGWLRRDHRKLIVVDAADAVDGGVAFVSGLCVGQMWQGRPEKKLEPWRDTGLEIKGPAVAHAEEVVCGELAARRAAARVMSRSHRRAPIAAGCICD